MTDKPERVALIIRLPADIHGEARALAQQDDRSLNWQLVTLLREALAARRARPAGNPAGATQAGPLADVA